MTWRAISVRLQSEARAESAEREQRRVGRLLHAAEEERGQLREHLRMLSEAKVNALAAAETADGERASANAAVTALRRELEAERHRG